MVSTSFSQSKPALLDVIRKFYMRVYYIYEGLIILFNREEMACEEAELGPDGFEQKMKAQQQLQEQVNISFGYYKKNYLSEVNV